MKSQIVVALSLLTVPLCAQSSPRVQYCCTAKISEYAKGIQFPGDPIGVFARTTTFRVAQDASAHQLRNGDFTRFQTDIVHDGEVIAHGSATFAGYELDRPFAVGVAVVRNWSRDRREGTVDFAEVILRASLAFVPPGAKEAVQLTGESESRGRAAQMKAHVSFRAPFQVSSAGEITLDVECRKLD